MKHRISIALLIYGMLYLLIGAAVLPNAEAALWTKRYVVKQDQGKNILCDPYIVQQGEWIYKIFRQKGEISERDYPAFLDILKNINPQIGDIDQIYPGNLVLIPLKILTPDMLPLYSSESVAIPFASISDSPLKTVEVRKGDTVSKLLLEFYGGNTKAYRKALKRFKTLNPHISDPNRIIVGQKIQVPAQKALMADDTRTLSKTDTDRIATDVPQMDPSTEEGLTDPTTEETSVPLIADILKQIALLLDAELFDRGSYHFPVKGKEDLRLDLGLFPVIRLKDNTRIVFLRPFSKSLSDISVVKSQWKPVFFVRIPASPVSIYHMLDKVFAIVNLDHPRKKITFKEGGVTTDINAKWILKMENVPGLPDRHICLAPIDQKSGPFPETVFRYLAKHNITYWGVKPDGQIAGTSSRPYVNTGIVKQSIPIENQKHLIRKVVHALGWNYQENVKVRFPYAGLQVDAVSNMLTIDADRSCLVDFGNFAGDSIAAIEATGLKVISLRGQYDALRHIRQILKKFSLGYTERPTIFVENNSDGQGVSFTYPGLMVPQTDGQTLITSAVFMEEMKIFLESRGTQIIQIAP